MRDIDGTVDSFLEQTEQEDRTIICYGASAMARAALEDERLANRVKYLVDGDAKKHNKELLVGTHSFRVESPKRLKEEPASKTALLITSGHYREITATLSLQPELDGLSYAVWPKLLAACQPGSEEFFRRRVLADCLSEYRSILKDRGEPSIEALVEEKCQYLLGEGKENRPLVVPRVMILPTTRCNLRCKGCSSLLPLFEHPYDVPIGQTLHDLELFFSAVDQCVRLTVGGEPFLYPDLEKLLTYLLKQKKLLGVLLITNSTIQPSQETLNLLSDPKFYVEVSDYGHIRQMGRTVAALEDSGVRFSVLTEQIWDDMGGIEPRGRAEEERRMVYMNCEQGRLMKSIHNGEMFVCARSARLRALDCGYCSESDYFSLAEEKNAGTIRESIRKLFYMNCADACDRCDLGFLPNKKIPAGIQITGKMRKSEYTLVRRDELEALRAKE